MTMTTKHDLSTEAGRSAAVAEHTKELRAKAVANAVMSASQLRDDLTAAHAGADVVVGLLLLPLIADAERTLAALRTLKLAMEQQT